jgi:release factor glutamine methyltransferase
VLIVEALAEAGDSLSAVGIASAQAEARQLVAHVLDCNLAELDLRLTFGFDLSNDQAAALHRLLERRAKREPLQHILGRAPFRYLELAVGPGVFVPRPETEAVCELAIGAIRSIADRQSLALDVGTGSGAIAAALATETEARVIAIELSPAAAEYAAKNFAELSAAVELRVGDFRDCCGDLIGQLDVLISNPPYIPETAVPFDVEVRDYDPDLALYSGPDGLDLIRELAVFGLLLLKPGGKLILEHADGQSDAVVELLLSAGWSNVLPHPDATGRLRAVTAHR